MNQEQLELTNVCKLAVFMLLTPLRYLAGQFRVY